MAAGQTWIAELPINQPAATIWYHAHTHERSARQAHNGLAGVLQLSDGFDDQRGLPIGYGLDDLTLVLQDRNFDRRGRMVYDPEMPDLMMGFTGDTMVGNGQVGATAVVPKGVVRLRLLNGSNSRIYDMSMSDGPQMHLVATDNGLLDMPETLDKITLPAGRTIRSAGGFRRRRGCVTAKCAESEYGDDGRRHDGWSPRVRAAI